MGSSQSVLTSEVAVTGAILVAGAYLFTTRPSPLTSNNNDATKPSGDSKKSSKKGSSKKKKNAAALTSSIDTLVNDEHVPKSKVVDTYDVPGAMRPSTPLPPPSPIGIPDTLPPLDTSTSSHPSSKKSKKRKAKSATSSTLSSAPDPASSAAATEDDGWTKITRDKSGAEAADTTTPTASTSDAELSAPSGSQTKKVKAKKTLAERLLPKPPVTAVDDMVEDKPPTIARVIRVMGPEQPASGFSWGDYEDAEEAMNGPSGASGSGSVSAAGGDQDEDDGWGVVKSRRGARSGGTSGQGTPTPSSRPSTQEPTKKQRQNDAKKAALKQAKADAERERLATLARHKRELEKTRIAEAYSTSSKGRGGGKVVSGGMNAKVGEDGALFFE